MNIYIAAQEQQSWAERFNVNFLAAGASKPSVGSTGTGIYHGKDGSLGTIMSATPLTRIIVATVDKNLPTEIDDEITEKFMENIIEGVDVKDESISDMVRDTSNNVNRITDAMLPLLLKTEYLGNYSNYFLNFNQNQVQNATVCFNEEFCCNFNARVSTGSSLPVSQDIRIDWSKAISFQFNVFISYGRNRKYVIIKKKLFCLYFFLQNHYRYYAVAYYGNRTFDGLIDGGIISCAVIACTSDNFTSCGLRYIHIHIF